jgi:peptidoglycan/xylan/chitin deacetylase (PgdA/CDA1 family)
MAVRWVATLCVSAAVFAPALRLGHDGQALLQPSASAAESELSARDSLAGNWQGDAEISGSADAVARRLATPGYGLGERRASLGGTEADEFRSVALESFGASMDSSTGPGSGATARFFPSLEPRELLLSFDDGPDLKYTPLVLDELDRWGLKAIFFVTGHRLTGQRPEDLARRELVRKIAARGHLVANHTFSHRDLCRFPDDIAAEIDGNSEMIAETTGVRPLLFRAPYGARCKRLDLALAARGLVSVGWNLDPQDWKTTDTAAVLSYLQSRLARLSGRGILLLHDTHASSVFALAPLLEWIARENRLAVQDGHPAIVLQNYSVLLPARGIPAMGLEPVVAAMAQRTPRLSALFPSSLARR